MAAINSDFLNRLIVEEADLLIAYIDTSYKVLLANKKIQQLLQKPKEKILGKNFIELFYPINTAKYQMFKAVVDTSIFYAKNNYYEDVLARDNREMFVLWSFAPFISENDAVQGLLCIGYDATTIKSREDEVRKIDEGLRDITSSIKDYALYAANLDGNITYYSKGAELIFLWSRDEVFLKKIYMLHREEDCEKVNGMLGKVSSLGKYELQIELKKKDGTVFPGNVTVNQLLNESKSLVGYIFIAKDITEEKRMQEQVIRSEKLGLIGQMSAGVAHDIGNPLSIIAAHTDLLLFDEKIDPKLKERFEGIKAQVKRIDNLIKSLLKFSKPSKEKTARVNINELIETVLPFLNYQKNISKIKIIKNLSTEPIFVNGDFSQLQDVFVNLFINACQAMEAKKYGSLEFSTEKKSDMVQIRITDTGYGIPEDVMPKLFTPFITTKKEGNGLGLAICYNIVRNHNGKIEVTSEVGVGTTFIITLPASD